MSDFDTGGAGCAVHPNALAVAVCERCGAYMCAACNDGGLEQTCQSCRLRTGITGFPLSRDAWTLDAVFRLSWQAYAGAFGPLLLGELVIMGAGLALSFVPQIVAAPFNREPAVFLSVLAGGTVIQYGVQGVLQLGIIDMGFDALDGRKVRFATLIAHVSKVGRLLLQYLLAFLVIVLPTAAYGAVFYLGGTALRGEAGSIALAIAAVALLAPTLWLLLPLVFLQYELALDDDVTALESVRRCFTIAKGKRLAILGLSLLGFIVMFSGVILCGIGVVLTIPLGQVILSALFLAFRNGSGVPPPVRRGNRAREGTVEEPIFAAIAQP